MTTNESIAHRSSRGDNTAMRPLAKLPWTVIITIIFKPTSTKPQVVENDTYSRWLVVLNKTVLKRCTTTTEILWNRKETSWRSPDAADIRLPRSLNKRRASSFSGPEFQPLLGRTCAEMTDLWQAVFTFNTQLQISVITSGLPGPRPVTPRACGARKKAPGRAVYDNFVNVWFIKFASGRVAGALRTLSVPPVRWPPCRFSKSAILHRFPNFYTLRVDIFRIFFRSSPLMTPMNHETFHGNRSARFSEICNTDTRTDGQTWQLYT